MVVSPPQEFIIDRIQYNITIMSVAYPLRVMIPNLIIYLFILNHTLGRCPDQENLPGEWGKLCTRILIIFCTDTTQGYVLPNSNYKKRYPPERKNSSPSRGDRKMLVKK